MATAGVLPTPPFPRNLPVQDRGLPQTQAAWLLPGPPSVSVWLCPDHIYSDPLTWGAICLGRACQSLTQFLPVLGPIVKRLCGVPSKGSPWDGSCSQTQLKLPQHRTQNSTAIAHGLTSCAHYRLAGLKPLRAEYLGGSYDCVQSSQSPSRGPLDEPRWACQGGTGLSSHFSAIATQSQTLCGFSGHCGEAGLPWAEKGSCLQTHIIAETLLGGCRNPELARLRQ